ncbi:hypothetical protein [Arthrobacter sp. B2a2-09]|uniref:hypothetical protein n=1 Tax=Arthrobacter sp. B2a2-09 TaxID=2952822 RepID=UPI0022CD3368|nr:hypothetical protein [Arthrobacter sp. B2a2-09]MCZ9884135.1 hypothetical protein [Arthrobacter sp. B2a2-09]
MSNFKNAEALFQVASKGNEMRSEHQANMAALAQVQATLALASEHRTANLIAAAPHAATIGDAKKIWDQIAERLGLD